MTTETTEETETAPLPEIVRETIQAQHKFSIDETLKLKDDLLAAIRNETQIEAELASVKAEFKSRTEKAQLEKDSILRRLTDGFEMRPTRAVILFNTPEHGRKTYAREDTGEKIRDEPMTFADQERPLFKDQDGKDALAPAESVNADVVVETAEDRAKNKSGATEFLNTEGEGTKEDLGRILEVPNAGATPLAAALDSAAVKTEQPQIVIPGFERDDWTVKAFRKAFQHAARKALWPETVISTMHSQLLLMETVDAMKTLLRAHTISDAPSREDIIEAAKTDYPDGEKLRRHFSLILKHYPEKYPGGDSEHNFTNFQKDISDMIEDDVNRNRTTEGAAD